MRVKRCTDTELIDELDRACFPHDDRLTENELHDALWWVAFEGGLPVGYCGVLAGFLIRYGTVPGAVCRGVGRRVVQAAYKHHAGLGLPVDTYVKATNVPSLRCLLACGFVVTKATTDETATYLWMARGPKG